MRSKLIFITGVMALGLSACGVQGSDPVGGSSSSEVIVSAGRQPKCHNSCDKN